MDHLALPCGFGRRGAPGRTRTADASLRTAALCPLSYGGACRNRTAGSARLRELGPRQGRLGLPGRACDQRAIDRLVLVGHALWGEAADYASSNAPPIE